MTPLEALLRQIDDKRAELDRRRPLSPAEAARLREYLDLEWTYNSNAIEGSTLTRQETLVVLKHGLTAGGKALAEHLEVINHQRAIEMVEKLAGQPQPPTEDDIRALHGLVLRSIDDDNAGFYRQRQVFIAGSSYEPPLAGRRAGAHGGIRPMAGPNAARFRRSAGHAPGPARRSRPFLAGSYPSLRGRQRPHGSPALDIFLAATAE